MADEALDALAARAATEPFFLASLLAAYARSEGLDDAGVAEFLGCPTSELTMIRLCRAPRVESAEFWEDIYCVAERFNLSAERLAEVVQRGRVVRRFEEQAPVQGSGFLLAARDAEEPPQPQQEGP
jgi:hypothetical protein